MFGSSLSGVDQTGDTVTRDEQGQDPLHLSVLMMAPSLAHAPPYRHRSLELPQYRCRPASLATELWVQSRSRSAGPQRPARRLAQGLLLEAVSGAVPGDSDSAERLVERASIRWSKGEGEPWRQAGVASAAANTKARGRSAARAPGVTQRATADTHQGTRSGAASSSALPPHPLEWEGEALDPLTTSAGRRRCRRQDRQQPDRSAEQQAALRYHQHQHNH